MTCQSCSATNAAGARFCSTCGADLDGETTTQSAAMQATVMDSHLASILGRSISGRYRIDAKLGAGGMGAVYRATRLLIGDEVAVKILHSEQNDPRAAERFRREAYAAARLKHANAVTIHDFGVTDDGLQYLVMELVEGKSLRQLIKHEGPLTPSAAAEIINQACAALDEAHRHNIIHRDIKPDNIIVNVTATGLMVKVLDFGIAKLRDDVAGNLTQTGSIVGTPHYMSPEQCLGEEIDSRSDIYSLGVVLYEMLTGLVPFNSPTSAAVVVQQVTQPPPSLRGLNASLSPEVERVVLHALEKQRAARPQTASELAREFKNATQPNVRAPGSSSPPANPPSQGYPSGIPGSGSIPTMVLTDQSSGHRLVNPALRSATATPTSSKQNPLVIVLIVMCAIILLGLGGVVSLVLLKSGEVSRDNRQETNTAADRDNSPSEVPITLNTPIPSPEPLPLARSSYDSVEERIVRGERIDRSDLEGIDRSVQVEKMDPLELLRNAIYARHGLIFKKEKFRLYFFRKPWYSPRRYEVGDPDLTATDKANRDLIKAAEKGAP